MRLFLAVGPAGAARDELARELTAVRRHLAAWDDHIRWTPPENVHVTVRFLGETPAPRVVALVAALGDRLEIAPFEVTVGDPGVFASRGAVRTLWFAIREDGDALARLHDDVSRILERAGWPADERPFTPHVTVGRVREGRRRQTAGLAAAVASRPASWQRWTIDRLILYSSDLSGPRPVHHAVHAVRLDPRG